MREYKLTEYLKKKPEYARIRLKSLQNLEKRSRLITRRRSRTEERILMTLDRERWKHWLEDRKIEITGNRCFRFHLSR